MDETLSLRKKERIGDVLFLLFLFVFYIAWAWIQPLDASPDEHMRYQVAEYIYQHGSLPHGGDPAIRNANWGFSYAFNPILDYQIAAVFMKIMSFFSTKEMALVMAARMVSVLFGMGTAVFAIKIGNKVFTSNCKWIFISLTTLLPGAVFVTSYVNCDAIAIFSTAMMAFFWLRGMETQWSIKTCIGLGAGVSVCALSYYNAYGFILCSILFFGVSVLWCSKKHWDYKQLLKKGLLITGVVAILAGWWFIRNYMIYDGDILGMKTSGYYGEMYAIDQLKPSVKMTPQKAGMSVWQMVTQGFETKGSWFLLVTHSFIGRFGHFDIFLPVLFEKIYLLFLGIGGLGVFVRIKKMFQIRKDGMLSAEGVFHWCLLLAMIIPNVLSLYYSYASDYQSQGRYSLPMLIPLMYFAAMGYRNWMELAVKNDKIRNVLYIGISVCVAAAAIFSYLAIFLPAYR